MELVTRLVTKERVIDLEDPEESKDLNHDSCFGSDGKRKGIHGIS